MHRPTTKASLLLFFLLTLQGCASLIPGFAPMESDGHLSVSPSGFSNSENDPPPAGVLTQITPELIAAQKKATVNAIDVNVMNLIGDGDDYRIGAGDVIGITVYDHPEIAFSIIPATTVADSASISPAPGFIVSPAGRLSFPYAGQINAMGLTVQELENLLVRRLSIVYKSPMVSVRITAFRSKRVYIEGEVKTPGLIVFADIPMTLAEALNRAGSLTNNGDRSAITLIRKGISTTINLTALERGGVDPTRVPLKNEDILVVGNRNERKVVVLGEVVTPTTVPLRNGRLSLNEALSEAGGANLNSSNTSQIYVIRNEASGGQSIFHLDARTPTVLALADQFDLRPRDLVYVDAVPLVRWNRLVNLLTASASTLNSARDLTSSSD